MKVRDKNKWRRKFSSYRRTFLVYIIVFLISLTSFFILARRGILPALENGFPVKTTAFLTTLFFLSVFVFGPTIYAPFNSFSTLLLFGALSGLSAGGEGNVGAAAALFFDFFTGYLLTVYSSFVTLTSMKIFTLTKEPVFEGTMFSGKSFRSVFNFRFIFSYILFFILFCAAAFLVGAIKGELLTLV